RSRPTPCNSTASLSPGATPLPYTTPSRSASIANQSKTYGADDPSLSGIAVGLSGQVNRTVTNWMGGTTAINDTGAAQVAASLNSLTRNAGESVAGGPYSITAGTLHALTGTSPRHYTAGFSEAGDTPPNYNPPPTSRAAHPLHKHQR